MDATSTLPPDHSAPPRVWLLQGRKAGDNAQLEAVAEALARHRPLHLERVQLDFAHHELLVNLLLGVSLMGLTAAARARLAPPWPDLILTAGRRNEPVARWIQRANRARTRLVHVGRPWAQPSRFDLIVTTPQYFLDPARWRNVLTLPLPPVKPLASAASAQGAVLLLVGGTSGNKQMDRGFVEQLFLRAQHLAHARERPLRLLTSPRTPPDLERLLLERASAAGVEACGWHRGAAADNPYARWLSEASAGVVTEDSMSMIAEVAARGCPLWIARLPRSQRPWWQTRRGWGWKSATHELAQRLAPRRLRRDTDRLLQGLIDARRACWLDAADAAVFEGVEAALPGGGATDAERAARAVAALLD